MLAAVDRFAQAAAGHTRRRSQSTKPCKGLARGGGGDGAGRGRQSVEAALRCGLDWLQVLPLRRCCSPFAQALCLQSFFLPCLEKLNINTKAERERLRGVEYAQRQRCRQAPTHTNTHRETYKDSWVSGCRVSCSLFGHE